MVWLAKPIAASIAEKEQHFMNKVTMRNLALVGFVGDVLGSILLVASGSLNLQMLNLNSTITIPNLSSGNHVLFESAALVLTAAVIVSFIAWIGGLIRAAQVRSWGWFVLMLVFGVIATLIYGLAHTKTPNTPAYQQHSPPQ